MKLTLALVSLALSGCVSLSTLHTRETIARSNAFLRASGIAATCELETEDTHGMYLCIAQRNREMRIEAWANWIGEKD